MLSKSLILFIPLIATITLSAGQIYYAGFEANQSKQPTKHNRQPIESDKCLEGEFLYPGDNERDWACDCKPLHVYYPKTMKCYQVYEQGPCKTGEVLVLLKNAVVPICTRNICQGKKVNFNGKCVNLNAKECPHHLVVQINPTTLQLICGIDFANRFGNDEQTEPQQVELNSPLVDDIGAICNLGGKRSQEDKCKAS